MATDSPRRVHLIDLVMAVLFCGLVVAMFTSPSGIRESNTTLIAAVSVGVFWYLLRYMRAAPICDECGARFYPTQGRKPATACPNCRNRKLTHDQLRTDRAKVTRSTALTLGIMAIFGVSSLVWFIRSIFNSGNWIGLLAIGAISLLSLLSAWQLVLFLIRSRRLSGLVGEEATLAKARACAGEDGTIARNGATTIWYSGPDDPVPMLSEEFLAAHRRFEDLLGETAIPEQPLCILCFHDRDALSKFYKACFPNVDLSAQLGLYLQRPWNVMTLCTGLAAGRLPDPRSLSGSLYCMVLLEQVFGQLPAPWLRSGIAGALAGNRWRGDLVALNRRMIVALSQQIEWSEDLFTTSVNKLSKQLLRTNDPRSARRSEQFGDQACSIVEYLAGEQAPEARKAAFRAFLRDKRASRRHEETFFHHFGFGFGSLLDACRPWVLEQGIGPDLPPPPHVLEALLTRVLPVIRDPEAPRGDRILAIRDWKKAGVTLGADTLIELLRNPGDISKDEIIWSLNAVSGMPWGDDPARWQAWWDDLSTESTGSAVIPPNRLARAATAAAPSDALGPVPSAD
jgi:hypothetical protein